MRKLVLASVMISGLVMPALATEFEDALRYVKAMNCMEAFYDAKDNYEVAHGLALAMMLDWQDINGQEADGGLAGRIGSVCFNNPSFTLHEAIAATGK